MKFAGHPHSVPAFYVARFQAGSGDRLFVTHMPKMMFKLEISSERESVFWSYVDVRGPDECWPWLISLDSGGYGLIRISKRTWKAHRVAFLLSGGSLTPSKPHVLHACHNTKCCNPKHLRSGTHRQNMQDRTDRGLHNQNTKRGQEHGMAKLKADQVAEMRERRASGLKLSELSSLYGVGVGMVWNICSNRSWRNIL